MRQKHPYYILLISIHGLIRSHDLELGRDPDTGGQTKYVVELARALDRHDQTACIELVTRRVLDPAVASDYAEPFGDLGDKARIVRIEGGQEGYIAKELLWDSLDNFSDNLLAYLQGQPRLPDVIHSHYADAGYVGTKISNLLGIPLVHTGHSLGRIKRRRLLAGGMKSNAIEERYHMTRRIDAEEETLGTARLVITSTHQEIEEQYGRYDFYQPTRMRVIPPGTDLEKFKPATGKEKQSAVYQDLCRFLNKPDKPIILALSRPDQRKNIQILLETYGESERLQTLANLVIVAGNRDDIREMDDGAQEVLGGLLFTVDLYDLYGKVAYPKHHSPNDVPFYYQLAASSKGVFINPALTEPFGLTLIEAAACGIPIVATDDGGPKDIIGNCHNGHLINPLDKEDIEGKLFSILSSPQEWEKLAKNGIREVARHYSWQAHVDTYINALGQIVEETEPTRHMTLTRRSMTYHDRAIFSDLDNNLLGDPALLKPFINVVLDNRKCVSFGIATGRRLDSALKEIKHYGIPQPDVLITSLGTEIYYSPDLTLDKAWEAHIDYLWKPKTIRRLLAEMPGIEAQPKNAQSYFKASYFIDPKKAPGLDEIISLLHQHDVSANVIHSFGQYLDIIPMRANKGYAVRWYADQWDIPLGHILAAGGSGADEEMMRGNTLAVVVANRHDEELSELADIERIYFATKPYAAGILEAIDHYDFFGACRITQP